MFNECLIYIRAPLASKTGNFTEQYAENSEINDDLATS
jgi:hypothetical protein